VTAEPITSVLVANRGEIARRVFRSARDMGLRCVAVYVDADADAPFVHDADEAVRLPTGYLDGAAVVAAAVRAGVDAVHPGYGFLSESAAFARAVGEAGLVWIGPTAEVIDTMGDKIAAKAAARAAGVPTLPSSDDVGHDGEVGYPLLVKAAAGGGGKGMRVVTDPADLDEAVAAAQREARAAFGDDRVFLERYVARSRHVEIQILGDAHGGLVHLGERECSIQRRHQKIIEESPSPVVDESMRRAMGEAALALARALGYRSAGTVEFLVDEATREHWFLEVNTRLQVEHPVTEAVTGIDLVREQIRLAAGEPLGYGQEDITINGHAIEARLYAEDVAAGFLPATGTIAAFEPAPEPEVRWDSGVESGSVVGTSFDPMLAKVVASAPTRGEAASRLALALERLHLGGVETNRDFLAATLRAPEFAAGDTTTDFIERVRPPAHPTLDDDEVHLVVTAAALWVQGRNRADAVVLGGLPSGWRNARLPAQRTTFRLGERTIDVTYRSRRGGTFLVGDGSTATIHAWTPDAIDVEIDGRRARSRITVDGEVLHVQGRRTTIDLHLVPRFAPPDRVGALGGLVAPMPGVAIDVRVAAGDTVVAGQVLVVLEAMKMEHHVSAPDDGVVTDVHVRTGDQVPNGAVLLVIEPPEGAERAETAASTA
jgi:propionyl-CoA carboxylase alpha chain